MRVAPLAAPPAPVVQRARASRPIAAAVVHTSEAAGRLLIDRARPPPPGSRQVAGYCCRPAEEPRASLLVSSRVPLAPTNNEQTLAQMLSRRRRLASARVGAC